jgi:LysM domain
MEFWFIDGTGKHKLRLPVPPPDFNYESGQNIPIQEINEFGEFSSKGEMKLDRISIKSFFPVTYYSFCQYKNFPKPYDCVKLINDWRNSKLPIRLLVTETSINKQFFIENFTCGERAGSRDVEFELSLVEYKPIPKASPPSPTPKPPSKRPPTTPVKSKTYTVKKGDTLWDIARRFYNNPYKWTDIAKANGVNDPKKLQIGKVLRLP